MVPDTALSSINDVYKLNDRKFYTVNLLARLDWLEHGFGTRDSSFDIEQITTVRQIHSDTVIETDGAPGVAGEGDALITDRPGALLGIKTADCLPILIADERLRTVAAIHAGWR